MLRMSIIVATYNRAELLGPMLESVHGLRLAEDLDWEVVIVDNNSSDATRATVDAFQDRLPVRYIFEPRQGKSFALNTALREAKGELLLFTDDDVKLHEDWAAAFLEASREYPDAGWFGGRSLPWWPRGMPAWLNLNSLPSLRGYFCLYDLESGQHRYTEDDLLPIGASMAVRRATFAAIGGYREDLGPKGKSRGVGDDTELLTRAIAQGIPGWYVPAAVVEHYVPAERLWYASFFRYGLRKGADQYAAEEHKKAGSYSRAVLSVIRAIPQLVKGRADNARLCLLNAGMEFGRIRASKEDHAQT